MTGFDETVPPDDDPTNDENSADPAHDSVTPAVDNEPDPDEPGSERQPKASVDLEQDDEMRAGQYGPTADYGER